MLFILDFGDFGLVGFTVSSFFDFDRLHKSPSDVTFFADLVVWACEGEASPLGDRRGRATTFSLEAE